VYPSQGELRSLDPGNYQKQKRLAMRISLIWYLEPKWLRYPISPKAYYTSKTQLINSSQTLTD